MVSFRSSAPVQFSAVVDTIDQLLDEAEAAAQRADELHRWQSQDYAAAADDGRTDESATDDY